jgi:hypothetical protein
VFTQAQSGPFHRTDRFSVKPRYRITKVYKTKTNLKLKIAVFWDVAICLSTFQKFLLPPLSEPINLWNVGQFLPDYTAQTPRKQPSSYRHENVNSLSPNLKIPLLRWHCLTRKRGGKKEQANRNVDVHCLNIWYFILQLAGPRGFTTIRPKWTITLWTAQGFAKAVTSVKLTRERRCDVRGQPRAALTAVFNLVFWCQAKSRFERLFIS